MTVSTTSAASSLTCPSCGLAANGRFCANCGASLAGATCAGCQAALTPGARFCHRCGTPAGAAAAASAPARGDARGLAGALPWAFAAIALVALIALVVGQRLGAREMGRPVNTPGSAMANGQAPFVAGGAEGGSGGALPPGRAPDISQMTPEQRAERLFDRIVSYSERGLADSVQLFAPMAVAAYQMMDSLNVDQRYDLGRVAEISGDLPLARAQADTILRRSPTHLLGLVLALNVARRAENGRDIQALERRLVAAAPSERAKGLREYLLHQVDIDDALARTRANR